MESKALESKEIERAVNHIVNMMEGKGGIAWDASCSEYEVFGGWSQSRGMSPVTRAAFVERFGEEVTLFLENKAKDKIAERKNFWEKSKAKSYEEIANSNLNVSASNMLQGTFVWGVMDNMKNCSNGITETITNLIEDKEEGRTHEPTLCKVCRIVEVEDIEKDADTVLSNVNILDNEGGTMSEDVEEMRDGIRLKYHDLSDEEKRTFFSLVIMVRDNKGKMFFIDPQGYNYPRYIILPLNWESLYAPIVEAINKRMQEEKRAREEAIEQKNKEEQDKYESICAKWEYLMKPVTSNSVWDREYITTGKKNIIAMVKSQFPNVRFSISYKSSWGTGYVLKWKNGPTEKEVQSATNLGLFSLGNDTFDGMTDCAEFEKAKFDRFARAYGGVNNGVSLCREECEEVVKTAPKAVKSENADTASSQSEEECDDMIKKNVKFKGVEIHFPSIPSAEIRKLMKDNKWQWSRFNKCWYKRDTEGTMESAKTIVSIWKHHMA